MHITTQVDYIVDIFQVLLIADTLTLSTAGEDYSRLSGVAFTFRPPATRSCVTVNIIDDIIAESDEQFSVSLSNPSSLVAVVVGPASSAEVFIRDDDAVPPSSELTHGNKRTSACVTLW